MPSVSLTGEPYGLAPYIRGMDATPSGTSEPGPSTTEPKASRRAAKRSTFCTPSVHLEVEVSRHMEVKGREPDPAKANVNDHVTTAAAGDANAVFERPILYELAKIDPSRCTIVGIDVRIDGPTTGIATVYAIDRLEHSIARQADIQRAAQSRVEVPVLKFSLPEPKVEDFMMHTFDEILIKVSELRLAEGLSTGDRS